MLGRRDAPYTGRSTLPNVPQKARASLPLGFEVGRLGTRPHGERLEDGGQGVAQCMSSRERTKVSSAFDASSARQKYPRDVLFEGNDEVGVLFVVPKPDIELGVKLFNPEVLQVQRLPLRGYKRPVNVSGGADHSSCALMESFRPLKIAREPRT